MSLIERTAPTPLARMKPWLTSPWMAVVLCLLAVALFDPAHFGEVSGIAAGSFARTLVYIAFAVLMVAYLKAAGAETIIAQAFKGREIRMIVLAALFGGLAPFCSCQVIPFIAGLLALGAPLPAIMAFWLSSPLIDPPTLLITAAALGWPMAIAKAASAIFLGLFGGFGLKAMMGAGLFRDPLRPRAVPGSCCCKPKSPLSGKPYWRFWENAERRETFGKELASNALFLMKWLALAYVLEALLLIYVPADAVAGVVGGDGVGAIAVAALVGMPAYLNGYIAPPMVAGLIAQGMNPGAALTFMVAGAVSCIPAMTAIWSLVRRDVFLAYIGFGLAGSILAGLAYQVAA
ncbi:permease [Breoghania sp. JC706]|uniref:permease n=1 Tax=Breoghania sp. JC706 TaxID=3117732 RepID=UPI00300A9323